jgi:HK97 family phage portal protein
MKSLLYRLFSWLAGRCSGKSMPPALMGDQWSGTHYIDSYKRNRNPTPNELMAELKGTAWACASINAAVCAAYPPRLYVTTTADQPIARCATRPVTRSVERRLRNAPTWRAYTKSASRIEEVTDHSLLDLLARVNPIHNGFDLWELTTLYLEVHGRAFWYLDFDPVLGTPGEIWPLPSQNVTPKRRPDSTNLIDYYEYRSGTKSQRLQPSQVIFFRYPDPRDPYLGGLSPLRACFEQVAMTSHFSARKQAIFENDAIPAALISPETSLGEEERDRLEAQWNHCFQTGGAGRVLVAEGKMNVSVLQHSLGDLALLADYKMTKEDIANAFHVPLSYLTTNTNLANLQAARTQHMSLAIDPRLQRRDEKLNEQLVPLFDPSGRLFLASEDPVPVDQEAGVTQMIADLKYGVVSINEVRGERGLAPVPWGDVPWLPMLWARTDYIGRADVEAPKTGRNRPVRDN